MKPRTLFILLALFVLLALLAQWALRREPAGPPPETGDRVLRTEDINAVTRVEILGATQHVALARIDTEWVVETLWNYPARFEQLANLLRDLDRLRVVEVIRGGSEILPEVGLVEDGTNVPVQIRLFTGSDKPTDELHIGKPRANQALTRGFQLPDSRYMRRARGPVILAEPFMNDVPRRPSDWMQVAILDLRAADITRMMAVPSNGLMYAVDRTAEGGYAGVNVLFNQPINKEGADLWFRAFQNLTVQTVIDPALERAELGAEGADLVAAYLKNGLVARVEFGATADEAGNRYAWFSFSYEGPAEGEDAYTEEHAKARSEVERLNRDVAPWTFVMAASRVNNLIFLLEQLIAAPGPDAES